GPEKKGGTAVSGADDVNALALAIELDHTMGEGKQGIILAATNVSAGVIARAALADQNAAGRDRAAAVNLDSQPLTGRVATVSAGALTFLMRHCCLATFSEQNCRTDL